MCACVYWFWLNWIRATILLEGKLLERLFVKLAWTRSGPGETSIHKAANQLAQDKPPSQSRNCATGSHNYAALMLLSFSYAAIIYNAIRCRNMSSNQNGQEANSRAIFRKSLPSTSFYKILQAHSEPWPFPHFGLSSGTIQVPYPQRAWRSLPSQESIQKQ